KQDIETEPSDDEEKILDQMEDDNDQQQDASEKSHHDDQDKLSEEFEHVSDNEHDENDSYSNSEEEKAKSKKRKRNSLKNGKKQKNLIEYAVQKLDEANRITLQKLKQNLITSASEQVIGTIFDGDVHRLKTDISKALNSSVYCKNLISLRVFIQLSKELASNRQLKKKDAFHKFAPSVGVSKMTKLFHLGNLLDKFPILIGVKLDWSIVGVKKHYNAIRQAFEEKEETPAESGKFWNELTHGYVTRIDQSPKQIQTPITKGTAVAAAVVKKFKVPFKNKK
ncbi:predicted protein, partial [Naegleria gruberi]